MNGIFYHVLWGRCEIAGFGGNDATEAFLLRWLLHIIGWTLVAGFVLFHFGQVRRILGCTVSTCIRWFAWKSTWWYRWLPGWQFASTFATSSGWRGSFAVSVWPVFGFQIDKEVRHCFPNVGMVACQKCWRFSSMFSFFVFDSSLGLFFESSSRSLGPWTTSANTRYCGWYGSAQCDARGLRCRKFIL